MQSIYRNHLLLLLLLLGTGFMLQAQNTLTFTESYTGGVNPSTAQRTHWNNFKASLTANYCYTAVHLYGSNNQTGFTITDPNYVATIAADIRQGISFQIASGGHNWQYCGDDLRIDGQAVNYCSSCDNGNCLRPLSSYGGNWGGLNGATCGAGSQTITLQFTYNSPTVNLGNDTTVCADSLVLNAGNAGATYLWQDNSTAQYFIVRTTGTYVVTVSSSCGSATDTIQVTLNHPPAAPGIISGSTSICPNTQATYSIGAVAGATGYSWVLPANWSGSSTGTSITATAAATGGTITVAATNGCGPGNNSSLAVSVKTPGSGIDTRTACNSFTWVNGQTYTTNNNTATYTYTGSNGCDSVVTLHLTILHPTTGIDTRTACNSFTWVNGQTYTTNNNTATYTYTGSNGCDSVVTLHLTILHPTTGIDTRTACNSFTWVNGQTYTTNNNTATYTYTGSNGCDSVVTLHLTITNSVSASFTDYFCPGSNYNFNGQLLTQQGTYTDTIPTAGGCDSIITLTLNETIINDSVTAAGATLTAIEANAGYQWIDCATQLAIPGATTSTFTPLADGNYACVIYKSNCADTTTCLNVSGLGLHDKPAPILYIYPNPTTGLLMIERQNPGNVTIKILNLQGVLLSQVIQTTLLTTLDISEYPKGLYFIEIADERQQKATFKICKQ